MASMIEPFETKYASQEVLEREMSIPLDGYDKEKGAIKITYNNCFKITESIINSEFRNPLVCWTNDEPDSLLKIGYPDKFANELLCNTHLNARDKETDKDGNRIYYKYSCYNYYKMVYRTSLNETPFTSFDFTVNTPDYTTTPYEYIHYINVLGRRMNSFNMYLSSRLVKNLENNILTWTKSKSGSVSFSPVNSTQLITAPTPGKRIPLSDVKIQMCVSPNYLYWVIETLIRHNDELCAHGMERFKFMYLVGDFILNSVTEIYPDAEDKKGIDTYGDSLQYRREVLNSPNVVFYLKDKAHVKKIADILCGLFPEKYLLSLGVPRFNMRLNRNVYISFGGNNEGKFNLNELYVPKEYARILETKNPVYNELSHMFSGHTLMHYNGNENNIQSYKKLIPFITGGSFAEWYAYHGLQDYYNEVFGKFNRDIEEVEKKVKSKELSPVFHKINFNKPSTRSRSTKKIRAKSLNNLQTKLKPKSLTKSRIRAKSWNKSRSRSKSKSSTKSGNKIEKVSDPFNNKNLKNLYS